MAPLRSILSHLGRLRPTPSTIVTGRYRSFSSTNRHSKSLSSLLRISEEVRDAVATNKPVVALESTIYTHGALGDDLLLEDIVRDNGAVPAVCGILDGVPTVGLLPTEVQRMVSEGAKKVSRRDLAYLVGMGMAGQKLHGGTTIAGTMILARLAGIRIFGTGGLGGVHRGAESSMDISADLTELGKTRVAVVSSGCKGFLDIPRTLEFLETQGVVVSTFADGRTGNVDFPAFWARESGSPSPSVVQDEKQAAAMILAQEVMGIESGLLFANPISAEFAIPQAEMDAIIKQAVQEADEKGYTGNRNTPYILGRIRDLTQARSVHANKVLVQANVARAATIAVELSKLVQEDKPQSATIGLSQGSRVETNSDTESAICTSEHARVDVLVAGSLALDLSCDYVNPSSASDRDMTPALYTSNPAAISQSVGGVGHNVALAAQKVSEKGKVRLCSLVGDDIAGWTVLGAVKASGLDASYIRRLGPEYTAARTAQYVAINDEKKGLVMAMADMAILTNHSFPTYWRSVVAASHPKWLVVDANWKAMDIQSWIKTGQEHGAKIAFEPVSVAKSKRLFPAPSKGQHTLGKFPDHTIDLATPNQYELKAMYDAALEHGYVGKTGLSEDEISDESSLLEGKVADSADVLKQIVSLLPFIPNLVTKLGDQGLILASYLTSGDPRLQAPEEQAFIKTIYDGSQHVRIYLRHFPAARVVKEVVSVNGVGDTFLGVLVAGLAQGGTLGPKLLDVAQQAAVLTLESPKSVSDEVEGLQEDMARLVQKQ